MPADVRLHTVTTSTNLITEECCDCHVLFAMPQAMQKQRLRDQKLFYCPNGHAQSYVGETEEQKLRRRLQQAEDTSTYLRSQRDQAQAEADHQRSRAAGYKGALTKTKKRIAGGVCPCCNRSFVNLGRHMAGQHPDFAAVPAEGVAP